jgi:hypothetical protein
LYEYPYEIVGVSVADPDPMLFYPLDPGSRFGIIFFTGSLIPGLEGEIFLNYLKNPCSFYFFFTCSWNQKEEEKSWNYFSSLFLCTVQCTVGSGSRDENFWDPGSGMKNLSNTGGRPSFWNFAKMIAQMLKCNNPIRNTVLLTCDYSTGTVILLTPTVFWITENWTQSSRNERMFSCQTPRDLNESFPSQQRIMKQCVKL